MPGRFTDRSSTSSTRSWGKPMKRWAMVRASRPVRPALSPTGQSWGAKWSSGIRVVSVGVQPSSGCRAATRCAPVGPATSATR
jgi:hypothetical protein